MDRTACTEPQSLYKDALYLLSKNTVTFKKNAEKQEQGVEI
jgi:hypothetical protein